MSDEEVLTKEIAEQFLADEDSVDLSEFTAIEDDAAEALASSPNCLDLGGLLSLSDQAAANLAKHNPTNARVESSTYQTLCLGGDKDFIEISANVLLQLLKYIGSVRLGFDPDKQRGTEWNNALAVFNLRQDQRSFNDFTEEMEETLERKDLWNSEEHDWVFGEERPPFDVYEEFIELIRKGGNRTLWHGKVQESESSTVIFVFLGSESEVLERMNRLPDKK